MRGRLIDLSFGLNRKQRVTVELDWDFREKFEQLKDGEVRIEIAKYRNPRSLKANNYAWTLIEKLAEVTNSDKDSIYEEMLRRYGTGESYTDDAGNECKVIFSLREGIPPRMVARHCVEMGEGYIDGKKFIHYRAIKGTSEYNTKEMSVFLDGVVSECQDLGIETDTPEMLARYKEDWRG